MRNEGVVGLCGVPDAAACTRLHDVEQRCGGWLLMTHDRVWRAPQFAVIPAFPGVPGVMLGVRRAAPTCPAAAPPASSVR